MNHFVQPFVQASLQPLVQPSVQPAVQPAAIDVAFLRAKLKHTDLVNANVSPEIYAYLVEVAKKIKDAFIKAAEMGIKQISLISNGASLDICAWVYCIQSIPNVIDVTSYRYHRVVLDDLVRSMVKGVHALHSDTDVWLGWFYT